MSLKTCSLHVYFLFLSANARREKNGNNLVVLVQLQSKNLKTIVIHFKISPLIHAIRRVYWTCGPPIKPLVRIAHDREIGSPMFAGPIKTPETRFAFGSPLFISRY